MLAINNLKNGMHSTSVRFFLEPSNGILNITKDKDQLKIKYIEDNELVKSFHIEKEEFINSLSTELTRILPLCTEQNWTQEVNI